MSAIGSACPPGFRDDDFMLFSNPIPCSLNMSVHKGLFIAWTVVYALALLEVTIAVLCGSVKRGMVVPVSGYALGLASMLVFCSYVIARDYQVAVGASDADAAVMWIFTGTLNFGYMLLIMNVLAKFTKAASSLLTDAGSSGGLVHRGTRAFLFALLAVDAVMIFVTLLVLVQVLPDAAQRDVVTDAYALAYGVVLFATLVAGVAYVHILRIKCAAQIRFLKALQSVDNDLLRRVRELRARLGIILIFGHFSVASPLVYFLIGSFLRWRYEMVHVFVSATCMPTIIMYMIYTQSPALYFLWGRDWSRLAKFFGLGTASTSAATSPTQSSSATTDVKPLSKDAIALLESSAKPSPNFVPASPMATEEEGSRATEDGAQAS